jgi:CheY-like chemotaxis protein
MRILIADDDDDTRFVLGGILRGLGHEVEEAADGVEALERARQGGPPSLIILDMMMPRLDGEGVIHALRSDPGAAQIPVAIISGNKNLRERVRALGASGWLVKPVELDQLLTLVERLEKTTAKP